MKNTILLYIKQIFLFCMLFTSTTLYSALAPYKQPRAKTENEFVGPFTHTNASVFDMTKSATTLAKRALLSIPTHNSYMEKLIFNGIDDLGDAATNHVANKVLKKINNVALNHLLAADEDSEPALLKKIRAAKAGCTIFATIRLYVELRNHVKNSKNSALSLQSLALKIPHSCELIPPLVLCLRNYQEFVDFLPEENNVMNAFGRKGIHKMLPWIESIQPNTLKTLGNLGTVAIDKKFGPLQSPSKKQALHYLKLAKAGLATVRMVITLYKVKQEHTANKGISKLIPYAQMISPITFECATIATDFVSFLPKKAHLNMVSSVVRDLQIPFLLDHLFHKIKTGFLPNFATTIKE